MAEAYLIEGAVIQDPRTSNSYLIGGAVFRDTGYVKSVISTTAGFDTTATAVIDVVAGEHIVCVGLNSTDQTWSFSDSEGNTYTQRGPHTTLNDVDIWDAPADTTATVTITGTIGAARTAKEFAAYVIAEATFDEFSEVTTGSGTSHTFGSSISSTGHSIHIGGLKAATTLGTTTPGNQFIEGPDAATVLAFTAYKMHEGGAETGPMTSGGTTTSKGVLASYEFGAAPASDPPTLFINQSALRW